MQVIEAQRASILEPHDHLHIHHERTSPMKQLTGQMSGFPLRLVRCCTEGCLGKSCTTPCLWLACGSPVPGRLPLEAWQHDAYSAREQFGDGFPEPLR
jgi:hypothetical protein